MKQMVTLGSTGITVNKNGFGALPIQRISTEDAVYLLHKAYKSGIDFYDTAHAYTDSEKKLGEAFHDVRETIYIATKTAATTADVFWKELEESLESLRTDYIDIYQFHNPDFCPKPGDGSGLYEAALEAKAKGKIRHIGITNHRLAVAKEAIASGLYETLQFPFCYLAAEADFEIVQMCKEKNMGFISMKALSGGLITSSAAAYAFQARYPNALPIWGIQRERELAYIFISHDLGVVRHIAHRVLVMYLGRVVEEGESRELFAHPLHPYTRALLDSVPRMDSDGRPAAALQGDVPSPADPPSGCLFHTRCPYAREVCAKEAPELRELGSGHKCACHFPGANEKEEEQP